MGTFGVPLSGDERITHEVNGVTYRLRPPIGKTEREIRRIQKSAVDLAPYLAEATAAVEKEHKGRSWKPGERTEAIANQATALAELGVLERFDAEDEAERTAQVFDVICAGWEGADFALPEGDTKPSEHLTLPVMKRVVSWYLDQMMLTEDEAGKSTRRRSSSSRQATARKRSRT
jgi:hypothetical protein